MKEVVSIAASHFTAFPEAAAPRPLTEVILVTAEPAYRFHPSGSLVKDRALAQARFTASARELREIARTLSLWADERDRMSGTPLPIPNDENQDTVATPRTP